MRRRTATKPWTLRLWLVAALVLFVSALLSPSITALGIASGRISYDFEPGLSKTVTLRIINNEHRDMNVAVLVRGELAPYLTIDQSVITLGKDENEHTLHYTFTLPDSFADPGQHLGEIVVMELPSGFADQSGNTVIQAAIAVVSQLVINVPYPGKYIQAEFFVPAVDYGKPVEFTTSLHSLGTEDIQRVTGSVEILGPTNEQITEIDFNAITLHSRQMGKITATLDEPLNPGIYHAVASIDYDGEKTRFDKDFSVGRQYIELVKLEADDFRLGQIGKFNIELKNKWNNDITNVYGELAMVSRDGAILSSTKTASVDIKAGEKDKIFAYLNTESINPGIYDLDLIIHYANLETRERQEIEVGFDSVAFTPTGRAVAPKLLSQNAILTVLVVVLVGMNLLWFFYIKKLIRPKQPKNEPPQPAPPLPPLS